MDRKITVDWGVLPSPARLLQVCMFYWFLKYLVYHGTIACRYHVSEQNVNWK